MPRLDRALFTLPDVFDPSLKNVMRVLCSWCGVTMKDGDYALPVSHGICEACSKRLEQEEAQATLTSAALDIADGDLSGAWQLGTVMGELMTARRTR